MMVDIEVEKFTAATALSAGLGDAIKRGETNVEGHYKASKDSGVTFTQRIFTFTDRMGTLRSGRFESPTELRLFLQRFEAT